MLSTDLLIIGSGPCGLFTVFEAGLLKLKCHIVDVLPQPGGQLTEIYPKKPIYDIPGYPEILASDLVANLLKQIEPFHPGFTLGERAEKIERDGDGKFLLTTNRNTVIKASVIVVAGGLGCFEPRRYEDWIQIYNASDDAVNLGGWFLSDKVSKPEKWKIKAGTIISGKSYLVVWASGRDEAKDGHNHTNFKFTQSNDDEYIVISNPNGNIVESVKIGFTQLGHSFSQGR